MKLETALNIQQSVRIEQIHHSLNKLESVNNELLYGQLKQERKHEYLKKLRDKIFYINQILESLNSFNDKVAKYWAYKAFNINYVPYLNAGIKDLESFTDKEYTQKILSNYTNSISAIELPQSEKEKYDNLWETADNLINQLNTLQNNQIDPLIEQRTKLINEYNTNTKNRVKIKNAESYLKQQSSLTNTLPIITVLVWFIIAVIEWNSSPETDRMNNVIITSIVMFGIMGVSLWVTKQNTKKLTELQSQISEKEQQMRVLEDKKNEYEKQNIEPILTEHPEFFKYGELLMDFYLQDLDLSLLGYNSVNEFKKSLKTE